MNQPLSDRWEDYFDPGETLLWEGAPMKGNPIGLPSLALSAFGMPFLLAGLGMSGSGLLGALGLMSGWDIDLPGFVGGIFMFFFGIPFLAIGGGMVFGPTYAARMAPHRVRYALSNKRAYIASRWWARKMEVLSIAKDALIEIENGKSVFFHYVLSRDSDGDQQTKRRGFENISDAKRVYDMIRHIQREAAT